LIGYRGSGKSTVASHLAALLEMPLFDSDSWVEQRVGQSIAEIFEREGESAFRNWETLAIESLDQAPASVVSLGGGAVLRDANRTLIRDLGWIVWLHASPLALAKRIAADEKSGLRRPSLTGRNPIEEIDQVMAIREPLYRSLCDWDVETTHRSPSMLAQAIADWYASQIPSETP
jgi:shikimate kinase